jgi:pyruvate dehydrogenase (quinone)/pyruvate oxidase
MAKQTAADILVDILVDWGVEFVFGLPGDGINGIMEALRKRQDRIRFIQVRHEESAAFMACGYAKFTGKLGVCLATSGPGGIHLLNGLYDAKLDGQPVLAITGHHFHDLIDTHAQQDVDLDRLFMDVAVYTTRVMGAGHVENVTHMACRAALSQRGVAHLNFPVDLQEQDYGDGERSKRNIPGHNVDVFARGAGLPAELDLRRAADVLNSGRKVAMLVGQGALGAADELEEVAETLGAPIIKALLGKGAVPDDSPYTTGGIGLLGTEPSQDALAGCDTLFIVGSSFPYMEYYPKPGKARGVQVDVDPSRLGLRFPVEVGLVGDARQTLRVLRPLLKRNGDRSFLEKAQKGMREWWGLMEDRGTRPERPMKPQVVAHELGRLLSDDAVVTSDSGTISTWYARHIKARRGQMYSLSGTLASMANGLPYAIAAQLAYPGRQVVAFVGDGGFSMLMGELATAVKYRLPLKIVIIKNNSLGQIRWEQMVFLGNPEYGCDLQPIDFAAFARACGATGFTIEDPAECAATLARALDTPGPVVVEAVVDPNTPPMPAKITPDQALHFAEAMARGEPGRAKIIRTVFKDRARELI